MSRISPLQKKIIRKICLVQIKSLKRIMRVLDNDEPSLDLVIIMSLENTTDYEDFSDTVLENLSFFMDLYKSPWKIRKANKYQLSMLKHILNIYGEGLKNKWPKAVANLWQRLFILSNQATYLEILSI